MKKDFPINLSHLLMQEKSKTKNNYYMQEF